MNKEDLIVLLVIGLAVILLIYFIWSKIRTTKSDKEMQRISKRLELSNDLIRLKDVVGGIANPHVKAIVQDEITSSERVLEGLKSEKEKKKDKKS